jgi:hypothetical protein
MSLGVFRLNLRRLRQGSGTTRYLREDGTFAVPPGGSGAPGGADTQIQFNDGGVFGGVNQMTWDGAGNLTVSANILLTGNILSLTGALIQYYDPTDNYYASFSAANVTANRTFTFPNASGTLALTSDIPAPGATSIARTFLLMGG